jgi:S1-C subfamily serine protease
LKYLGHPSEELFVNYINLYKERYTQGTKILLGVYNKKQKDLFQSYKEKNDYFKAKYYFNDILTLEGGGQNSLEQFNRDMAGFARDKKYYSLEKFLNQSSKSRSAGVVYKGPGKPNDYVNLLVQINVDRTYEADNKLLRKDYPQAFGSGILIEPRYVLTAYHVIEHVFYENTQAYSVTVITQSGKALKDVKIMAWDSLTDLAVLKLPEELPMPYQFHELLGNSDALKQGFDVYCLGNHEGLSATLTKGIISAVKRKAPEAGSWIQVDASLAPGASGGMLIGNDNLIYGVLVAGILYEDLNFAIPSNIVMSVLDQLKSGENVKRPWLGLLMEQPKGVKSAVTIRYVYSGSPLRGLGIRPGDRILAVNGLSIRTVDEGQEAISGLMPGNLVRLNIETAGGGQKRIHCPVEPAAGCRDL